MSPLGERRQRAREAFDDEVVAGPRHPMVAVTSAREAAIETATRVRVTPELLDVFGRAWHEADEQGTHVPGARRAAGLKAAFEAAGFEVEG